MFVVAAVGCSPMYKTIAALLPKVVNSLYRYLQTLRCLIARLEPKYLVKTI